MLYAAAALLLVAIALAVMGWSQRSRQQSDAPRPPETVGPALRGSDLVRTLVPQFRFLAGLASTLPLFGGREKYAHLIERAGLPFELSADEFIGIKVVTVAVTTVAALLVHFLLYQSWMLVAAIGFLGLVLPDLRLSAAVRKQAHAVLQVLPDFLDLLALAVEAGMGFDAAALKLTQIFEPGPLVRRFRAYLGSVNVGKTRAEALRDMSRAIDLPDFTAFTSAVIQASEAGSSLAPVLRAASADILARRFERASKMAHELPVKILLPLFLFVFPSTFLVILVPLWFQFKSSGAEGFF